MCSHGRRVFRYKRSVMAPRIRPLVWTLLLGCSGAGPVAAGTASSSPPIPTRPLPTALVDLPACPDPASASPDEGPPRPDLPHRHALDADAAGREQYDALLEHLGARPFTPMIPPDHGYEGVRRLLQPPIEIEPTQGVDLDATDLRVVSELGFGESPSRSEAQVTADLLPLLASLVHIDSQSRREEGNREVQRILAERLIAIGFALEPHEREGVMIARLTPPTASGARLLLIGHTDTVLPPDAMQPALCRRGEEIRGSGVGDMKGGLVVMVAALEALHRAGALADRRITVLLNSDEEIGSQRSRALIAQEASEHDLGLNFESGKITAAAGGGVTLARKGILALEIDLFGESAHSGVAHHEGIDAGRVAARVVESLGWLNDYRDGTTVNIGILEPNDDTADNRVLWRVHLGGEIRYWRPEQLAELEQRLRTLLAGAMVCNPYVDPERPVCSDFTVRTRGRPASPSTPARVAWFRQLAALAEALGAPVSAVASGGASDMNLASQLDMLDSFGPIGAGTHTPEERIPWPTLPMRARLTALTLLRTAGWSP